MPPPNIMISDVPSNFTPQQKVIINHLSLKNRIELLDLLTERTVRAKRSMIDKYYPKYGESTPLLSRDARRIISACFSPLDCLLRLTLSSILSWCVPHRRLSTQQLLGLSSLCNTNGRFSGFGMNAFATSLCTARSLIGYLSCTRLYPSLSMRGMSCFSGQSVLGEVLFLPENTLPASSIKYPSYPSISFIHSPKLHCDIIRKLDQ